MSADYAIRDLAERARKFAEYKPRKNPSAGYAAALDGLVQAARVFAVKSDEEWAADVLAEREACKEIALAQPYFPDTNIGKRQQWVKEQIAAAISARGYR